MISDLAKHAQRIPTWVLVSINANFHNYPDVKLEKKTSDVEEFEKSLDSLEYTGHRPYTKRQILKGGGSQG